MFEDLMNDLVKTIMERWDVTNALERGHMDDVESAIRESILRGMVYGGSDVSLVREAKTICDVLDKDYTDF